MWPLASPWYVEEESEPDQTSDRIHYRAVTGSIRISTKTPGVWMYGGIKAVYQISSFITCDGPCLIKNAPIVLCVCVPWSRVFNHVHGLYVCTHVCG